MGKVLLVRPEYLDINVRERLAVNIHIGILYIAASLRKAGYEVSYIDCMIHRDWKERLIREAGDAIYVGISAMTSQIRNAIEIAGIVRDIDKDLPLVWGGVHPSILPRQTLESGWCDVCVFGEGEDAAINLAKAFENSLSLDEIEGIAFMRNGRYHENTKVSVISNIDDLPVEIFDFYTAEEMETFIAPRTPRPISGIKRSFVLHTGRGCRFNCTFCINTILPETHRKQRWKSSERIIDEMQIFGERYNIEVFWLQDEDFFASKDKVVTFLELYERNGLKYKWNTNTRANYFKPDYISREFLDKMVSCGNIGLALGMESGSARMLKRIKKGTTPDMIRNTARTLRGSGATMAYALMMGMPYEEREDIGDTIKAMWDISHIAPKNHYFIGPAFFRPYPGSNMFNEAVELGYKAPQSLEDWKEIDVNVWGYTDEKALPYIRKNMDLYIYITDVLSLLIVEKSHIRYYYASMILRIFLKPIALFRIKTGFWNWLFEINILRLLKRIPLYKSN